MSHYPEHKLVAFANWVQAGMPDTAEVQADGEPRTLPAHEFLQDFVRCTDKVPAALRDRVVEHLRAELGSHYAEELADEDFETYGQAAHELLELLPELKLTRERPTMERLRETDLRKALEVEAVRGVDRLVFLGDRAVGRVTQDGTRCTAWLLTEEYLGSERVEPDDADACDDFAIREIARALAEREP